MLHAECFHSKGRSVDNRTIFGEDTHCGTAIKFGRSAATPAARLRQFQQITGMLKKTVSAALVSAGSAHLPISPIVV